MVRYEENKLLSLLLLPVQKTVILLTHIFSLVAHQFFYFLIFRLVLYKERNMLLTELQLSRRRKLVFPQPDRMAKVRKSLGAVRHVLGERKRDKLSQLAFNQLQKDTEEEDNDDDGDDTTMERQA
jgi:hypothetical protein